MAAESAPSREETNSLWIAFSGALSGRSICIRPAIPAASGSPRACRRRGDPRPFAFGGGERRKEGGRSRDSWPRHRAFRENLPGCRGGHGRCWNDRGASGSSSRRGQALSEFGSRGAAGHAWLRITATRPAVRGPQRGISGEGALYLAGSNRATRLRKSWSRYSFWMTLAISSAVWKRS